MTTALYWGVHLPERERRWQAVRNPRRCPRHVRVGRCHHFHAHAPEIENVTDITTETPGYAWPVPVHSSRADSAVDGVWYPIGGYPDRGLWVVYAVSRLGFEHSLCGATPWCGSSSTPV